VGRAEFRRRGHGLEIHTEIAVSPEDDIELRRARIVNRSRTRKVIELTTYAEIVLAPPAEDIIHPAFSKLFVQTEIARDKQAILATRRQRSADEHPPWMFHLIGVHGTACARRLLRDRPGALHRPRQHARSAAAMRDRAPLSGSEGPVLDPIVGDPRPDQRRAGADRDGGHGLRVAETRDGAIALVDKYQDRGSPIASSSSRGRTRRSCCARSTRRRTTPGSTRGWPTRSFREPVVARRSERHRAQPAQPIGVVGLRDLGRPADRAAAHRRRRQHRTRAAARAGARVLAAQGLAVDLVIWNEDRAGYGRCCRSEIMGLVAAGVEAQSMNRPGGIFVRPATRFPKRTACSSSPRRARIICDSKGTLAEQIAGAPLPEVRTPNFVPTREHRPEASPTIGRAATAPRQRDRRLFRRRDRVRDFDGLAAA
jgi:hypothetical protein